MNVMFEYLPLICRTLKYCQIDFFEYRWMNEVRKKDKSGCGCRRNKNVITKRWGQYPLFGEIVNHLFEQDIIRSEAIFQVAG